MDDLSQRAIKLVIEYCVGILDESAKKIRGKVSLARLEVALTAQCGTHRGPHDHRAKGSTGCQHLLIRSMAQTVVSKY
jgi:hypothetical protein